jgi:hypothetical protein
MQAVSPPWKAVRLFLPTISAFVVQLHCTFLSILSCLIHVPLVFPYSRTSRISLGRGARTGHTIQSRLRSMRGTPACEREQDRNHFLYLLC